MLYGDGSTETEKKPLQLISEDAKNRNPRELPFRFRPVTRIWIIR